MKIAETELLELQNIPVTPPLFKQPLRTSVRLLKVKTEDGLVGISQFGGFMHSATAAFIQHDLAPFLKGQNPLEMPFSEHARPESSNRTKTCRILSRKYGRISGGLIVGTDSRLVIATKFTRLRPGCEFVHPHPGANCRAEA